jgi:predicted nucleotidyltransferase
VNRHGTNVQHIVAVALRLAHLLDRVVFLGGAVLGFLLTDKAMHDVRSTQDVDVIVEVVGMSQVEDLAEQLRKLGFQNDINGPTCRYLLDGLEVDIMPMDGSNWGFKTQWYPMAAQTATVVPVTFGDDSVSIRLISAPLFVATKLDAFLDRGKNNYRDSEDIGDIIDVINGRPELLDELHKTQAVVREFIASNFMTMVKEPDFLEAITYNLLPDATSQARYDVILSRCHSISKFDPSL